MNRARANRNAVKARRRLKSLLADEAGTQRAFEGRKAAATTPAATCAREVRRDRDDAVAIEQAPLAAGQDDLSAGALCLPAQSDGAGPSWNHTKNAHARRR
jgi:hypothetical protein